MASITEVLGVVLLGQQWCLDAFALGGTGREEVSLGYSSLWCQDPGASSASVYCMNSRRFTEIVCLSILSFNSGML